MQRVAAGDNGVFDKIVSEHDSALRRMAMMWVGNASNVDDVLQQTYVAAFRGAATFRGDASLRTWLLTIVRNKAFRDGRTKREISLPEEDLLRLGHDAGWGSEDPHRMAERAENKRMLENALGRLPVAEREIISLRDIQGLTSAECARLLSTKEATLKTRLRRGRLHLAAKLREANDED